MNRKKRSVQLDLKDPGALEALMRIIETADVFVHSLRPSAAERLGIGYEAIKARNPSIVYANAPGFLAMARGATSLPSTTSSRADAESPPSTAMPTASPAISPR